MAPDTFEKSSAGFTVVLPLATFARHLFDSKSDVCIWYK